MDRIVQLNKWLASNPIIALLAYVAVFLTILGFILAFVFRKEKRYKELTYMLVTNEQIVNDAEVVDGLEVLFKGKAVSDLTVSLIAIQNSGTECIDKKDIPDSNPLRLRGTGGCTILDVENAALFGISSSRVEVEFPRPNNEALIRFDYLDDDDEGIWLVVSHTGKGKQPIELKGRVKGGTIVRNRWRWIPWLYLVSIHLLVRWDRRKWKKRL